MARAISPNSVSLVLDWAMHTETQAPFGITPSGFMHGRPAETPSDQAGSNRSACLCRQSKSKRRADLGVLFDEALCLSKHAVACGEKLCFPFADRIELAPRPSVFAQHYRAVFRCERGQLLVSLCQSAPGPVPATSLVAEGHSGL